MRRITLLVLVGGMLAGVNFADAAVASSDQEGYFPLRLGNEWVYSVYFSPLDSVIRQDTVRIDDLATVDGQRFYHLSTPGWFPFFPVGWVSPDSTGDIYGCDSPGGTELPFYLFSGDERWSLGVSLCDSVMRSSCGVYPFEDVVCVGKMWRPGDCPDVGWNVAFARDLGPVLWSVGGNAGTFWQWQLLETNLAPETACKCHGDPVCDGLLDVRDVIATIAVAFRGSPPQLDHGCSWFARRIGGRTDINCSGETDILDVSEAINVALRGGVRARRACSH